MSLPKVKKPSLTKKERALIVAMKKPGVNQTKAAAMVYDVSPRNAAAMASQAMASIKRKFPEIMEEVGITDLRLAQKLSVALDAEAKYYSKAMGDFIHVPEWNARLKALDMALKLRSHYPKEEVDHNVSFTITRGLEPISTAIVVAEPVDNV